MGKPKKANVAIIKNVNLEKQITDGKVAKAKNKDKVKLRAEETAVREMSNPNPYETISNIFW